MVISLFHMMYLWSKMRFMGQQIYKYIYLKFYFKCDCFLTSLSPYYYTQNRVISVRLFYFARGCIHVF